MASGRGSATRRTATAIGALTAGYLAASVPFAQYGARRRGVDLRRFGTGTVSGTGLFRVAGPRVLATYGVLEVAKGAVGPALAARVDGRRDGPLAAVAALAAVAGHNWSPLLGGAGGRGVSPAMGALLVCAPAGSAVLLTGLAVGKLAGETALGCAAADLALVPALRAVGGRPQARAGLAVLVPIVVKRLAGNGPPMAPTPGVYLRRLLLDRDTWTEA